MNLKVIDNDFELWLPQDEEYYKHGKWLEENYPSNSDIFRILFEVKNGTTSIISIHGEESKNKIFNRNSWFLT